MTHKFTQKQKIEELFRRGIIIPWQAHAAQKQMAAAVAASTNKKYVINCARRLGKSTLLCMMAIEHAIQRPNSQIKYAAETQRSVKKIIVPLIKMILEQCPKHLRPNFKTHDGVYEFSNGSELHIAGSALDTADSLRGTACDLAIVDEAGFIDNLEYLIDSVLLPQCLGRPNARIIMASTPSRTPDHPFVSKYMAQAMQEGAYSRYTIYDNPRISAAEIEEMKKEAGGENSTTWRREYLAEIVTETANALFPEASDADLMRDTIQAVERPRFFIPLTAVDLGYIDFTGILFGYYHFALAKVVIEDEILVNKHTSAEIVSLILSKEKELWGDNAPRQRIVDGPSLAIADMNHTHRFMCRTPEKHDLAANVNRVRMDLAERRLLIHPRCTSLAAQLTFATWDTTRTKFSRNSSGGHWDLASAIIYLLRHADRTTNPVPAGYGFDPFNQWGFPGAHKNSALEGLRQMFPFTRRTK